MRLRIVLNRSAGALQRGVTEDIVRDIERRFSEVGNVESLQLVDPPLLHDALVAAAASKPDVLIVGGGDGTISSAASIAVQTSTTIGVLPLGTLNHFARDLGLPVDYREAISSLRNGVVRWVDVGEVNGRIFINNSSLGLYPMMVARRQREQRALGLGKWPALVVAGLKTAWGFSHLSLTVDWGRGPKRVRVPIIGISNNRYDLIEGLFVHRSRLDAGALGVYVARARNPWQLLRSVWMVMTSKWRLTPDLTVLEVKELNIGGRSGPLLVASDGEVYTSNLPLRFLIRERALPVFVPRPGERH